MEFLGTVLLCLLWLYFNIICLFGGLIIFFLLSIIKIGYNLTKHTQRCYHWIIGDSEKFDIISSKSDKLTKNNAPKIKGYEIESENNGVIFYKQI